MNGKYKRPLHGNSNKNKLKANRRGGDLLWKHFLVVGGKGVREWVTVYKMVKVGESEYIYTKQKSVETFIYEKVHPSILMLLPVLQHPST